MPNKFDRLAEDAAREADESFKDKFSSLTRLNDAELEQIIFETGISKQDLNDVLKEVKNATVSNEAKAKSILKINNGVSALVAIARRFV
jgi:hypothetical protein